MDEACVHAHIAEYIITRIASRLVLHTPRHLAEWMGHIYLHATGLNGKETSACTRVCAYIPRRYTHVRPPHKLGALFVGSYLEWVRSEPASLPASQPRQKNVDETGGLGPPTPLDQSDQNPTSHTKQEGGKIEIK
jgi:hypothetical protein